MVDHVLQCIDMLVGCVKRDEGSCDGQTLLGIVGLCVKSYSGVEFDGGASLCRAAEGYKFKSVDHVASVGCDEESSGCPVRCAVRTLCQCSNSSKGMVGSIISDCDIGGRETHDLGFVSEVKSTVKSNVQSVAGTCVESEVVAVRSVGEEKRERNRQWREKKKERKKKRQNMNSDWRKRGLVDSSSCDLNKESSLSLRASLEKKWKAQNDLAVEKAQRELEVLKASAIDQEVKRYRTKVSAATERNMVSIEKTHAFLRSTGNVSGERGGGFAETVVSGEPGLESGSGTISPDSSASMAEFRNCQKALLDAEKKIVEYERIIKIATEKYGFPVERVDYMDKTVWTDTQSNRDILDDLYPDGYGMNTYTFDDGKFMPIRI